MKKIDSGLLTTLLAMAFVWGIIGTEKYWQIPTVEFGPTVVMADALGIKVQPATADGKMVSGTNPLPVTTTATSSSAGNNQTASNCLVSTNAPTLVNGTYAPCSMDTSGQTRGNQGALNDVVDFVSTNPMQGTTATSSQVLVETSSTFLFTVPPHHLAAFVQSYGNSSTSRIHLSFTNPATVANSFGHLIQDQISCSCWFRNIFGSVPVYAISDGLAQSAQTGTRAP